MSSSLKKSPQNLPRIVNLQFQALTKLIMKKERILVVGANGQIGGVLTQELGQIYGLSNVIASDIRMPQVQITPFELLDILDKNQLDRIVRKYNVRQIYHLAAILSAKGEQNPKKAWDININGLFNVLEIARTRRLKLFFPSSIAVFGSHTPRQNTPQTTIIHPETVYGISKAAGENWCQYYHQKFQVDIRSLRYPGIIGYQSLPGGGTTDYAVEIFHKAVKGEPFSCFFKIGNAFAHDLHGGCYSGYFTIDGGSYPTELQFALVTILLE